ncbi:MAG: lysozyme family protein [Lactococcus sp.]|uniref:Lysozyme-like protein n=1 Tax=Pseudolactococcus piscium MKFS47 TaxID=297352 RepID=A0A0D6DVY4_9LACT|nr:MULTISPECIES: lysozyme family protein [Lactococcus]MDN5410417.1 lysozyme family protein [Lactococcus sp.]MDN5412490.1 lysozyme family protein [Lactococcus sp.]MDN5436835.1 lysozyme family protein [Lactococcus sp.]MDN5462109.1 lysozyme family protein [Lactococcus sp.]MDN5466608.1 lysozyme family protein [Lactococcus sp.]
MLKFIKRVLLFVIVLGAGFWVYRTHENVKSVMQYDDFVTQTLKKYGVSGNRELVLSIIYTETKGKHTDVMQSTESTEKTIETEEDSIHQGITNLTEVLAYANEQGVDVWTGVQAYNFGKAYVDYIAKNGGKNTLPLAEAYSKDVVAPSLGNTTGEEYYHITLDSLRFNKGKLYKNGGNIFYAKEVRWNMKLVQLFNW